MAKCRIVHAARLPRDSFFLMLKVLVKFNWVGVPNVGGVG